MDGFAQAPQAPAAAVEQRQPGLQGAEIPGHAVAEAFAEAVEALLAPAVAVVLVADGPGMQGLDQQLAAAFQQRRPGRQATGKVFVEQGEIAHQGVETTEPRGRIQLAVGQAPEAAAARRAGEFDQFRRGVDADAFADLAGQRPAQPALAAADIQQAPRRALAQRLENRVVGGQAAAFQASSRTARAQASALPRQLRSSRRLRSMGSAQGFAAAEVAVGAVEPDPAVSRRGLHAGDLAVELALPFVEGRRRGLRRGPEKPARTTPTRRGKSVRIDIPDPKHKELRQTL